MYVCVYISLSLSIYIYIYIPPSLRAPCSAKALVRLQSSSSPEIKACSTIPLLNSAPTNMNHKLGRGFISATLQKHYFDFRCLRFVDIRCLSMSDGTKRAPTSTCTDE